MLALQTGLLFSIPMSLVTYGFLIFGEDLGVVLGRPRQGLRWHEVWPYGVFYCLTFGLPMGLLFGRVEAPLPTTPPGALEKAALRLGFQDGEPVELRGVPAIRFPAGRWGGHDDLLVIIDEAHGPRAIASRFVAWRLRRALARVTSIMA